MRRVGVIFGGLVAVAVMLSASQATAASYGTVYATYTGDAPTSTGQISMVPSGYTALPNAGATHFFVGRSNFIATGITATGTSPADAILRGALGASASNAFAFSGYCIDVNQIINTGAHVWTLEDLADAPLPGSGMGMERAGRLQNLLGLYAAGVDKAASPSTEAAALAASVWEVVNETSATLNVSNGDGVFYVNDTSGDGGAWVTRANVMLANLSNFGLPTVITVKALVSTTTQDFAVIGGTGGVGPPVPEPLTMIGAFLGISTLGMYIRKRTKKATAV